MSLLDAIKSMIPKEDIDGTNPRDIVDHVDLSIAFTPVVERSDNFQFNIPKPVRVQKQGDRYCLMYDGDFQWTSESEIKECRARYLLLRGWYYRHLGGFSYSEQQKLLAWYFDGGVWRPQEGSELAKAMGIVA